MQADPALLAEVKSEWGEALAGLNAQQLRAGWDRTRAIHPTWPPTPMEFRLLCLPTSEDLGLPSTQQAYSQVMREYFSTGSISHPAVAMAFDTLDKTEWRMGRTVDSKKMFAAAYEKIIAQAKKGEIKFDGLTALKNDNPLLSPQSPCLDAPESTAGASALMFNADMGSKKELKQEFTKEQRIANSEKLKQMLAGIFKKI